MGTRCFIAMWCLLLALGASAHTEIALPSLGDGSSSLFSQSQEHTLGRAWLSAFRSQVKTIDDPLMQVYIEQLIYKLASHSELQDRRLEVVIVDNPTMNAFAVPGGVIGVHSGLFLFADTEAQLASVLGHELAHLSQRHFVRGLEARQRASIPTMAGLLASIVLAATAGGDAGIAAMTATQAAALQNQLRYSRQNEQEADRIGMDTLVAAGYDPNAAPAMFDNMQQALRYAGQRPPEFLLTHPLTENRIADTRNRARQYPQKIYTDTLDYQLLRARAELQLTPRSDEAVKRFRSQVQSSDNRRPEASRYGLALAYTRGGRYAEASEALAPLLANEPNRLEYVIARADIEIGLGELDTARQRLQRALAINPSNHPLTMAYANALLKSHMPQQAEALLQEHVKRRPTDPAVWYLLAEVHGLAGNIVGVHQARAEYFVLNGVLDRAIQQLGYALPLVKHDRISEARIQERIRQIQQLKIDLKQL